MTTIKRFFTFAACAFLLTVPISAQADLATVAAVHNYVRKKYGVNIPYTKSDSTLITMKYLMQVIDTANEILNEVPISDYATDPRYATQKLAKTSVTREALDNMIKKVDCSDGAFCFKPAATSGTYSFAISAAGTYRIAWGDGSVDIIKKTSTGTEYISHDYANAPNTHEIMLSGHATTYVSSTAAVSFSSSGAYLSAMRGCLGCIFSTIHNPAIATNARQPSFGSTFKDNSNLVGSIPETLFNGISGAPVSSMFYWTFYKCSKLTGEIPENLFAGLSGAPAASLFVGTFENASGLTGTIPAKLFAGIKGQAQPSMFQSTFKNCSQLTGPIPATLFESITGPAQYQLFRETFSGCSGLTGKIPETLFSGISAPTSYAVTSFYNTFSYCTSLYGPSAKIGNKYLYEIWPGVSGQGTYTNDKSLSDYECIPTGWGGGGTKPIGTCESDAQD